jgi:6-phosphogluconolactonase
MPADEIQIFETIEGVQEAAARHVAEALRATTAGRDVRIALSGGSTPRGFHERLAASDGVDWSRVHVYWGDERTVPPDHPESNYRMARETLLHQTPIPEAQVHRMRGELDPWAAAEEYEQVLRRTFDVAPPDVPSLDVNILGVGPDGHTASLFPGTEGLSRRDRWVVANEVPQHRTWRITMTYPVLNAAKLTLALVSGESKAEAVRLIFSPNGQEKPPAALVRPAGRMIWLLDRPAASRLQNAEAS